MREAIIHVKDGDTVVLSTSRVISEDEAHRIKMRFERLCPGTTAVVIGGIDQVSVYRP